MATAQTKSQEKSGNNEAAEPSYTQRAASTAHETVDKVADRAAVAEEMLRDTASNSAESFRARQQQLQEDLEAQAAKSRLWIAQNPYAAAGIAFGTGVLLTALLRRR